MIQWPTITQEIEVGSYTVTLAQKIDLVSDQHTASVDGVQRSMAVTAGTDYHYEIHHLDRMMYKGHHTTYESGMKNPEYLLSLLAHHIWRGSPWPWCSELEGYSVEQLHLVEEREIIRPPLGVDPHGEWNKYKLVKQGDDTGTIL